MKTKKAANTKNPAAPQSLPLPGKLFIFPSEPLQIYRQEQDGKAETLRNVATAADPKMAALIVRRVNQGPEFDAMATALEQQHAALLAKIYKGTDDANDRMAFHRQAVTNCSACAALKLAQEAR